MNTVNSTIFSGRGFVRIIQYMIQTDRDSTSDTKCNSVTQDWSWVPGAMLGCVVAVRMRCQAFRLAFRLEGGEPRDLYECP